MAKKATKKKLGRPPKKDAKSATVSFSCSRKDADWITSLAEKNGRPRSVFLWRVVMKALKRKRSKA